MPSPPSGAEYIFEGAKIALQGLQAIASSGLVPGVAGAVCAVLALVAAAEV
jgi:hypothetical protein